MSKAKRLLSIILIMTILISSMFTSTVLAGSADIASYPLPSIYTQSSIYSVSADGVSVPVVNYYGDYDYTSFSTSAGSATIVVTVASAITSFSISPQKLNKQGTIGGASNNQLTFTVNPDEYLIVQINGYKKLIISCDPAETSKPASSGAGIFNITSAQYGADGSGASLSTAAIQKAIDDASSYGSSNGQGIVYVPQGVFKISNLILKSNVALYLEGGTVLKGSATKSDNIISWHKDSQNHDITYVISTAIGADNVKIYGRGTVDGDGATVSANGFGNNLIVPYCSSNFTLEGITVRDSASWSITPIRSNDITISNLKVLNRMNLGENDGIDICESQNVVVKNVIGIALDDPFSSKTWNETADISKNWYGTPEVNENIVFENCFSWTVCYGFKVGAGVFQNQNNITFRNSYVYDCSVGFGIAASYGAGLLSNITFDNIDVERINFTNGAWRDWLTVFMQQTGSRLTNVNIKNINIRDRGTNPAILNGYSSSEPIDGVTFDNITMLGNTAPATSLDELNITNRSNYKNIRFLQSSSKREAELFNTSSLITTNASSDTNGGAYIAGPNGAWAAFNNVDFGKGISSIDLRASTQNPSDSAIELRLDSLTGPVIGTANIPNTGSVQNYTTLNVPVSGAIGVHKLYLVFKRNSDSNNVASVNWFDVRYTSIEAESYNAMSGVSSEATTDVGGGLNLTDLNNGDYAEYDNIDFGSGTGTSSMNFNVASASSGGTIELRLDDKTSGPIIGTAVIESTGGFNNWLNRNVKLTGAKGVHTLFIIFKKSDSTPFVKVNNFSFIKNTGENEYLLPAAMTLNQTAAAVSVGQKTHLLPVFTPSNTNYNFATWSVLSESTPGVVTVDNNGMVTGLSAGTAVVRGTSTDPDVYADCTVTVTSFSSFTVSSIPAVKVTTSASVAPVLPSVVDVITDTGSIAVCDVVWDSIDPSQYQNMGTFTVQGTISAAGMQPTALRAAAEVTVGSGSLPVSTALSYEFEKLTYTTSSGTPTTGSDGSASGGILLYYGSAAGDWIQFPVNVPNPGTYNLKIKLKKHSSKGIFQLYIDGTAQSTPFDEYYNGNLFTEIDFGTVNFNTSGDKLFKFQITGKNASSTGYAITLDALSLTPSFTGIKLDKSSISMNPGDTASLQTIFGNMDSQSVTWSVLNASSDGVVSVSDTGTVSALKAGTAVVRVSSNKYSGIYADCYIRVKAAMDILPVQIVTEVGKVPVLPVAVPVINTGDNSMTQQAVIWDSTSADYSHTGNITIKGTVSGISEPAVANIKVFSPSNPLKVACVGDSITNGNGTANPAYSAYPIDLGRILGPNYVLGKFGHNGATLLKHGDLPYTSQTEYSDSVSFQPDVVIIQLGTNDSKSQNIGAFDSEFVGDYKDLINSYRNLPSHPLVYVALPPAVYTDDIAAAWGITNSVLVNSILPKIKQVADEAVVSLIDNNTLTQGMPQNFSDKVHPNEEGAALLANNVYPVITGKPVGFNGTGTVEAESYSTMSGISTETNSDVNGGTDVTAASNGDWISYNNIDFGPASSRLDIRVASANSGGSIEFRLDNPSGALIGAANITSTGGWQTWETKNINLTGASGVHNLYLVFTKSDGLNVANVNWFKLVATAPPSGITLNKSSFDLVTSQTAVLTAQVAPIGANTAITWSVINESTPNVATVDANGLVTANNAGTAVIRTASTVNPAVYADCSITVTQKQVKALPETNVTTTAGTAPVLPVKITATYADDTTGELGVLWNITPDQYANAGSFTITGTVSGTSMQAVANVTVNYASLPVITKYEAENSSITVSSGTIPTGSTDAGASNNKSIYYGSAVGDSITFKINVPSAGTYAVKTGYKKRPANGIWDIYVNNSSTKLGTIDMYASANTFASMDMGNVVIDSAGNIPFTFKVTGKNSSGSNYNLCADYITLTPVYSFTIDKPTASISQGLAADLSAVFANISPDKTGVKWSVASSSVPDVAVVSDTGTVTGVNPGTAVIRATSTVYANFFAESTITVLPRTLTSLENVSVTTVEGIAPILPQTITATYDNGTTSQVNVLWDAIDPAQYEKTGTFTVTGTVNGTLIPAAATVTVIPAPLIPIVSVQPVSVITVAGTAPVLPTVVTAVYSDNTTALRSVIWNTIDPSLYSKAGSFTVTGTVDGTAIPAVANVTVTAAPQIPTIVSIVPVNAVTVAGTAPILPSVVTAVYSDNTTTLRSVIWNTIDPSLYSKAGSFTVTGTVGGTPIPAIANVTVTAAPQVPTIVSIVPVNAATVAGTAPILPSVVTAVYSDNATTLRSVIWNTIDPSLYSKAGSFTATGAVDGTALPAIANVTVTAVPQVPTIVSIVPITVTTVVGTAPTLPTVVTAVYSDSTTAVRSVVWNIIDPSLYAKTGTFEVTGAIDGTAIPALATVNVKSKSGNSGGTAPVITPVTEPQPQVGANGDVTVNIRPVINQDNSTAVTVISETIINKAFDLAEADSEGIKQILINIEKSEGADLYVQNLPASALTKADSNTQIKINTPLSSVVIPSNMLNGLVGSTGTISINVGAGSIDNLNQNAKDIIGNRPIIDLTVKTGDKVVDWNSTETKITVSIPYKPTAKELLDPEHIVALSVDDSGNTTPVTNGKYDAATGEVKFTVNHLDKFAIGYVEKTFNDIDGYAWAKHAIEVMASKGVINGTSEDKFTPSADITRAEFMTLLVKALDLSAKVDENFSDVDKSDYYYNAVGIAKELGIANGIGDNKFNPDELISRQDMMVLVSKALKLSRKFADDGTGTSIYSFEDALTVSDYAKADIAALIKDGIVKGDGRKINPLGNTTRAEAAVIIYKIFNK